MRWLYIHESYSFVGSRPSDIGATVEYDGYFIGYKYYGTAHGWARATVDYVTFDYHSPYSEYQTVDGSSFSTWTAILVPDNYGTDLQVKLNSVSPTTLSPTGNITIDFTVRNAGTKAAGSTMVGIYASEDAIIDKSDLLIGYFDPSNGSGLAGGDTRSTRATAPLSTLAPIPGGSRYIGLIVDKDNAVGETIEGNNASNAIKVTSVGPTYDLTARIDGATPQTVGSNGSLRLSYRLTNSGTGDAIAPATVFYLSKDSTIDKNDLFLGSITVDLSAKSTLTFTNEDWGLYNVFAPGKYYLGAIIDRDGIINETNEGNNKSNVIPITITGPNSNPEAHNDLAKTNYETPVEIDILANDTDPNPGDKLSFELGFDPDAAVPDPSAPRHGKVTVNADKTITYTPDLGFVGKDTFTYLLFDDHGGQSVDSGFVTVDVGWDDVVESKGKLSTRARTYDWPFEIPEGVQGTYTFEFEITKPMTLHALVTSDGPDTAPVQFHPELIANLGNKAPTLGPGPDRNGRGDTGHLNEDGTARVYDDPLMPGKYAFTILRQPGDTGPAGGNVHLELTPDEAGNRIEWAAPARLGRTIKGMVDRIDNKDVYKFTLTEQSSVAVSLAVAGLTNKADGVPALHYEIMTNAGSPDFYHVLDSHMATSAFIDTAYTAPEQTDVANAPLDPGDYYVIIYHSADAPYSEDTTDERLYNLWINAWADHAANRPLTTDFGAEGPRSANIGDLTNKTYANRDFLGLADADDFYMFSLSQRSTVRMALTQSSKDVSMDLEFSSMSGGAIAAQLVDAVGDGAGPRTIVATLDAGTYMLRAHTDTDFGNTTASNGYGLPLVLPHKGGSTYDLKITSSTTLSTLENGTPGADNYLGGAGNDRFNGKAGDDRIRGGGGGDNLIGDLGMDWINGEGGDDFIVGGANADTLIGGPGRDTFGYLRAADGSDTIQDFVSGEDSIGIVKSGFGLPAGVSQGAADQKFDLALHYFVSGAGAVATEAHGQFIFDTASHQLLWDANGTGAGGVTVLATLSNGASVKATDITFL